MPLKFFVVSVRDAASAEAELNAFLRSHRILSVDRRWVEEGDNSFWSICVDYLEAKSNDAVPTARSSKGKVDYKEVLSPEDFAVFAKLRELRKQIGSDEAVPVYTIFTNEQLAQIVQSRADSKSALRKIEGVGDAKIEKYGDRFLQLLSAQWNNKDETDGKPVREDS